MIKKRRKLKKRFKIFLLVIITFIISIFLIVKEYNNYLYRQTNEYKLLEKGYDKKTVNIMLKKLNKNQIDTLLEKNLYSFLDELLNEQYFITKNFDSYVNYYMENKKDSFGKIISIVNVDANNDWYENSKEISSGFDYSILVNKFNLLPEDFTINNIKTFTSTYAYGNVSAEEECYNAFIKMANDAKKEGITFVLSSGYRTYEQQSTLYNQMKSSKGSAYADLYVARPGSSEHQTGLALDLFTVDATTTETFKNSVGYNWLIKNADKYGFILRYPENKTYLTGYNEESWHWRYLGVELAKKVKKTGLTYDEYYAYYLNK